MREPLNLRVSDHKELDLGEPASRVFEGLESVIEEIGFAVNDEFSAYSRKALAATADFVESHEAYFRLVGINQAASIIGKLKLATNPDEIPLIVQELATYISTELIYEIMLIAVAGAALPTNDQILNTSFNEVCTLVISDYDPNNPQGA